MSHTRSRPFLRRLRLVFGLAALSIGCYLLIRTSPLHEASLIPDFPAGQCSETPHITRTGARSAIAACVRTRESQISVHLAYLKDGTWIIESEAATEIVYPYVYDTD